MIELYSSNVSSIILKKEDEYLDNNRTITRLNNKAARVSYLNHLVLNNKNPQKEKPFNDLPEEDKTFFKQTGLKTFF
jgi:hypothetical protein